MTCREVADFLMDYVDGTLPAEQRSTFDRHVAVCPDCQKYVQSYKLTVKAGKAAFDDTAQVPEGLVKAILKARAG